MIFRKNLEPACIYCRRSEPLSDENVICRRRGIVPHYGSCRKFAYDPCKRHPERVRKLRVPDTAGL